MKKVLVLTILAGMGHVRAAEAVSEGIRRVSPESVVRVSDPLEKEPKKQRFVNDSYVFMARHMPHLWGFLYNSRLISGAYSPIRWLITRRYAGLIALEVEEFQPDVIVSTHPFLAAAVGMLKRAVGRRQSAVGTKGQGGRVLPLPGVLPLVSVATDFHVHPFGINNYVDTFVVPCEEMARYLEAQGVASERIAIEGIPISPRFSVPIEPDAARKRLGFDKDKPLVLMLSGGFGIGPVLDLLEAFRGIDAGFQLAIIIGRDEGLRERAEKIAADFRFRVKVFGFVDNMEDFLSAADVVITKPGGMSTSEALAKRVPLVLMQAIKGQEEWNVRVLAGAGAAIYPQCTGDIPQAVCGLLADEGKRSLMKEAAGRLEAADCAENIGRLVTQM